VTRRAIWLVALLATLALAPAAGAATFTVDRPDDASDSDPTDNLCDAIGGPAGCTLRAAIEQANANAESDAIVFADGLPAVAVAAPLVVEPVGCVSTACSVAIDGGGDVTVEWSGAGGPALRVAPAAAGSSVAGLRIERVASGGGALLRVGAPGATLSSLTLANAATSGLEIGAVGVTGTAISVDGSGGDGVAVFSGAQNVALSGLAVSGSGDDGIAVGGTAQSIAFPGASSTGNAGAGIAVADTARFVSTSGAAISSNGGDGVAVRASARDVSVSESTVSDNGGDGVDAAVGTQAVTVSRTTVSGNARDGVSIAGRGVAVTRSPVFGNALAPISLAAGGNDGIAPPQSLRIGPRRADGTLPLTGTTPGGSVEIYRGHPELSQPIAFLADVAGGSFEYVPSPEPAPGSAFAALARDDRGSSAFAVVGVPDDIASPDVSGAIATSRTEVRVRLTEPVDPATVDAGDFSLEMAGVSRPIAGIRVEGSAVTLTSSSGWTYGDAGFVALTAPGALADGAGNQSVAATVTRVGAAPGDLAAPVATRLSLRPRRMCLTPGRRCRRAGTTVAFVSDEPGRAELVVMRGPRRVGVVRAGEVVAGRNAKRFSGRVRGRKLRSGTYRLLLFLEDEAGNRTIEPPIQRFVVVRTTR
jgi:hypothetical protein